MADLRERLSDFNRAIDRRDSAECLTAAVGAVVVVAIACLTQDPWLRAGSLVLAASSLGVLGVLCRTRRSRRRLQDELALEDYCRINREVLDVQIRLLRRVLWWYIAPLSIGLNLSVVAVHHTRETLVAHIALNVLFSAVIFALNLQAVRKDLVPLREDLDLYLAELGASKGRIPCAKPGFSVQ